MKLRTEIDIKSTATRLNHKHKILGLGSCFVENMGRLLACAKLDIVQNPGGILYNPYSIGQFLKYGFEDQFPSSDDLYLTQGRYVHFDFHSQCSDMDADTTLLKMKESIKIVGERLKSTDVLMLTLGTSWVYRHLASNKIVANCHKLPSRDFRKEILSTEEIVQSLNQIKGYLPQSCRIILTVSPVRHTKDGLVENQRSKSRLIEASHIFVDSYESADYFPAYEIMVDDLRDYRFYESDLIHPNETAIKYIWQRFLECYISEESLLLVKATNKLNAAIAHRPFNQGSEEHKNFCNAQMAILDTLEAKYPDLNWDNERKSFMQFC